MAKLKKNAYRWHTATIATDRGDGEVVLVAGGKRAYLWAGRTDGMNGSVTISGSATLRALAKAILKEVGRG